MTTAAKTEARVLCCPVQPYPEAMHALMRYAPQADVVPLAEDDKFGYWREIRKRWTGERDLIIIEQDIEIADGVIESLQECDQDWCCYAYPIFRRQIRLRVGLGCTKISAAAQRLVGAREIAEGFELCAACKGAGCWWHLDGRITQLLKHRGLTPHVHGDVIHHHDYHAMDPNDDGQRGFPMEMFFENADPSAPARVIMTEAPNGPACNPRQARHVSSELWRMGEELAQGDESYARFVGTLPPPGPPVASPAYSTDKVSQGYIPAYHHIADQIGPSARVLEIGVHTGGSLSTWLELFPQGTVAGVDNDPLARWPEGTLRILSDQEDPSLPDKLYEFEDEWDLIVDDASHNGTLTAATFELLWPLVSPGGYYVIEDWFVGFPDYHGACKSPAMLATVQGLLDRLHWDTDTESVSYRYGMAIIRKKALAHEFLRRLPGGAALRDARRWRRCHRHHHNRNRGRRPAAGRRRRVVRDGPARRASA
jgi:hypothetical protein